MDALSWQYDWTGATFSNLRILVCRDCYDEPQAQNRAIVLPADPQPIMNARPEWFSQDETDYATETGYTTDPNTGLPVPNTTTLTTVSGSPMIAQPVGRPTGYTPTAQAPLVAAHQWNVLLPVISMIANGTDRITVTTSSAHGLSNDSQVGVMGSLSADASGAFSVTVTNSTQFTYQTNVVIASGSQLQAKTRVTTMNMGVPLTMTQIPQTGP